MVAAVVFLGRAREEGVPGDGDLDWGFLGGGDRRAEREREPEGERRAERGSGGERGAGGRCAARVGGRGRARSGTLRSRRVGGAAGVEDPDGVEIQAAGEAGLVGAVDADAGLAKADVGEVVEDRRR